MIDEITCSACGCIKVFLCLFPPSTWFSFSAPPPPFFQIHLISWPLQETPSCAPPHPRQKKQIWKRATPVGAGRHSSKKPCFRLHACRSAQTPYRALLKPSPLPAGMRIKAGRPQAFPDTRLPRCSDASTCNLSLMHLSAQAGQRVNALVS